MDEFSAFAGLLSADSILSGKVFDSIRVNTDGSPVRSNYVAAVPVVPREDDERYMAVPDADSSARHRVNVQVVAVDTAGLRLLSRRVRLVLGVTLTVTGRVCTPIRAVPGVDEGDARYDKVARLHYVHMTFEFWSRPA